MWHRIKAQLSCRLIYLVVFGVFLAAAIVTCSDNGAEPATTPQTTTPEPGERMEPAGGERAEIGDSTALIWRGGKLGIILVHGAIYDAASWQPQAERINAAGMTVVAVEDASADGVRAAVDYARSDLPVERVVLAGASAGVPPVLTVASDADHVAGIVVLAGTGQVDRLPPIPALFIAAENDGSAAERMRQMAEDAPGESDVLIVPGSAHAQAIFTTGEGEQVIEHLIEWLQALE